MVERTDTERLEWREWWLSIQKYIDAAMDEEERG